MSKFRLQALLMLTLGLMLLAGSEWSVVAQPGSRFFPQTNHGVRGAFLAYWDAHGGLARFGYPVSDEMSETPTPGGLVYTVQYFQRAVFELHPENTGTPYEVLLRRLGADEYKELYGPDGASGQYVSTDNPRIFPKTGHALGGVFRAYWEGHGGLAQFGYPLSDEFSEVNTLDSHAYTVQYFERAIFERHPENAGTPYEVLLTQLGSYAYRAGYGPLVIPPPSTGGIVFQKDPAGSGTFLAWTEQQGLSVPTFSMPGPPPTYTFHLLDLRTGRALTVARPAERYYPGDLSVSGAVAVWTEPSDACSPDCRKVIGEDLNAGTTFAIADDPSPKSNAVIAGRRVAWAEGDPRDTRIMIKDLYTGETSTVGTLPLEDVFAGLLISNEYVVWAELSDPGNAYDLEAYNVKTGLTKTVGHFTNLEVSLGLALDGHSLVWTDPAVHIADLDTGEVRTLYDHPALHPAIRGTTVAWSAYFNVPTIRGTTTEIWGLQLNDPTPRVLISNPANNPYGPAVIGSWLIWRDTGGRRLEAKRLDELFAPTGTGP
ncbi:MAG: hypothetical protein ACR2M0_03245 [Chloroflexia bacterium]